MHDLTAELRAAAEELRSEVDGRVEVERALTTVLTPTGRRRTPRLIGAAAAVLLLVAIAAVLANRSGDSSPEIGVVTDGDTTSLPSVTTTAVTTTLPPSQGGGIPGPFWLGSTSEALIAVRLDTGEATTLVDGFAPADPSGGDGRQVNRIVVAPDGGTAYYEVCCSPVVGEVFRVPVGGGEPERLTYGAYPTLSPDGIRLATIDGALARIDVLTLGDGSVTSLGYDEAPAAMWGLDWSPDGRWLVWEEHRGGIGEGEIRVLDLRSDDRLDEASTLASADPTGTPRFPTVDADGLVHVVRQDLGAPSGAASSSVAAEVWSIESGDLVSSRELQGPVADQGHDPAGERLVRTFVDGTVRLWSAGEPTELGTGYLTAALP